MIDCNFRYRCLRLVLGCSLGLSACGNPNVPLTSPPPNAFLVAEPITTPPTTDPLIATLLEREATGASQVPSVLALAAQFWGLPWPPEPPILLITARFWGIEWPPPEPDPDDTESENEVAAEMSSTSGAEPRLEERGD